MSDATATATKKDLPLDDVMMAMDVVDTLRHRQIIVERELSEDAREAELIARLREIYENQGIDVPDHVLRQGVVALKEERFVYTPPGNGLSIMLARLYVARGNVGKWLGILVLAAGIGWAGWYFGIERPRQQAAIETEVALTETLPAELGKVGSRIAGATDDRRALDRAERLMNSGLRAAEKGDLQAARTAFKDLQALETELLLTYDIRIVARPGESSGVWRRTKANTSARNYYLIVEAIGRDGKAISRQIRNEEDNSVETVTSWGVRVPKSVFDRVARDKRDDGIIQNAVIGRKAAGSLEPEWAVTVNGGAITRW